MDALLFTTWLIQKMAAGETKPKKEELECQLNRAYYEAIDCQEISYFGTESIELRTTGRGANKLLSVGVKAIAVLTESADEISLKKSIDIELARSLRRRQKKRISEVQKQKRDIARDLGSLIAAAIGKILPRQKEINIEVNVEHKVDDDFLEKHSMDAFCKIKAHKACCEEIVNFHYKRPETLADLLNQLDSMTGLAEAKEIVNQILSLKEVEIMRKEQGIENVPMGYNCVLLGNPGTAKTSFGILLAKIMAAAGIVPTNKFLKITRKDLCGQYIGETAQKVKAVIDKGRGGVIFVDEAYSLYGEGKDYGSEAIAEIVDAAENFRQDTVFIFAGYKDQMQNFLDLNEGLRSRINFNINFPDYSNDELWEIANLIATERAYEIKPDVKEKLLKNFEILRCGKGFGNGRTARDMVEKAILKHCYSLIDDEDCVINHEALTILTEEDFEEPNVEVTKKPRPIGIF